MTEDSVETRFFLLQNVALFLKIVICHFKRMDDNSCMLKKTSDPLHPDLVKNTLFNIKEHF